MHQALKIDFLHFLKYNLWLCNARGILWKSFFFLFCALKLDQLMYIPSDGVDFQIMSVYHALWREVFAFWMINIEHMCMGSVNKSYKDFMPTPRTSH